MDRLPLYFVRRVINLETNFIKQWSFKENSIFDKVASRLDKIFFGSEYSVSTEKTMIIALCTNIFGLHRVYAGRKISAVIGWMLLLWSLAIREYMGFLLLPWLLIDIIRIYLGNYGRLKSNQKLDVNCFKKLLLNNSFKKIKMISFGITMLCLLMVLLFAPRVNTAVTTLSTSNSDVVVSPTNISSESVSSNVESAVDEPSVYKLDLSDATAGIAIDIDGLQLEFGDLLNINYGGSGCVVVKAKISPQLTNKHTIDQNYYSVCKLIRDNGFDQCKEIQYWAVADMTNGDEAKVISFTLNSKTIKRIYDKEIVDNQLGKYADDLWIHPSLQ